MKITNQQIIQYFSNLSEAFNEDKKYIPMKISFAITKNLNLLANLAQEIDKSKMKIAEEYGILNEEKNGYIIKEENQNIVQKELNDLFEYEQEVDIKKIKISEIENLEFTLAQTEALMFMIEEGLE